MHLLQGLLCLLALVMSACAADVMRLPAALPEPKHTSVTNDFPDAGGDKSVQTQVQSLPPLPALAANSLPDHAARNLDLPQGKLTLSADAMPLNQFIHLALGEVLKLTIQVDASVASRKDAVTLHVASPVSAARLLGMVEDVLRLYNVALASGESVLNVLPLSKVATAPPELTLEHARTMLHLGRVMELIPLHYATSGEAIAFMRQFINIGAGGEVLNNERLNALLVIGDAESVSRFKNAVAMVDRPGMQKQRLRLIYPVYWQVDDLLDVVEKMLQAQGVPVASAHTAGGIRLIPVKQINALIVASSEQSWLDALLSMVKHLDMPKAVGKKSKRFIYFVRNARAKALGTVVLSVLSGNNSSKQPEPTEQTGGQGADSAGAGEGQKKTSSGVPDSKQTGGLSVVVDDARNVLIFSGRADAYHDIIPLLEALDKQPRQVLIEATIAEVKLDNSSQFGVEAGASNVDNSSRLSGVLSTIGGLGVGSAGLSYTLLDVAGAVRVKLNALATEGRAKVLATPSLLAMDNTTAQMQIGDQIAVLTQEVGSATATSGTTTGILRSFNYINTGVILKVTPTINEGGVVRMVIHQEVSTPGASSNNTPPIARRSVDTTLVAKSGQSILIGGLMSHSKTVGRTKVPLLGDIPIIGHLFSNDTITDTATELVILITPHIISGTDDAEYLTRAFKSRLGWATDK